MMAMENTVDVAGSELAQGKATKVTQWAYLFWKRRATINFVEYRNRMAQGKASEQGYGV